MKEFGGKIAVVTGAASGIGRAIADRCAQEGMKVVLADVEEAALAKTESELRARGGPVLAVRTDVSRLEDVKALADKTLSTFGAVHLLFNNAGVVAGTNVWRSTIADWQWVVGVNLWGVIHGVHVFVPIMLDQGTEGHVVNTASSAGLISGPGIGIYKVTKHAVVSLSETLYHELAQENAKVNVSVLCPVFINTKINQSARNRPSYLLNDPADEKTDAFTEAVNKRLQQGNDAGMAPSEAADRVFRAIREETFYILTHPEVKSRVEKRMSDILNERNPTLA